MASMFIRIRNALGLGRKSDNLKPPNNTTPRELDIRENASGNNSSVTVTAGNSTYNVPMGDDLTIVGHGRVFYYIPTAPEAQFNVNTYYGGGPVNQVGGPHVYAEPGPPVTVYAVSEAFNSSPQEPYQTLNEGSREGSRTTLSPANTEYASLDTERAPIHQYDQLGPNSKRNLKSTLDPNRTSISQLNRDSRSTGAAPIRRASNTVTARLNGSERAGGASSKGPSKANTSTPG